MSVTNLRTLTGRTPNSGVGLVLIALAMVACSSPSRSGELRQATLREAARANGHAPGEAQNPPFDPAKATAGEALFRSTELSLNGDTSCHTCHLEEFGSADGLSIAVGVGGKGRGPERLETGGQLVPRNTLPLWGRGAVGFSTLFWDGKVAVDNGAVVSQFGSEAPSDDPLIVAVHLPILEPRELMDDGDVVTNEYRLEAVAGAVDVSTRLARRLFADPDIGPLLVAAYPAASRDQPDFALITDALGHFIRRTFRYRRSRFDAFMAGDATLTADEVAGGLVFYGKGRCASCHTGPHFTDFRFHAIAFAQHGFGKNGFGVDYGRYNVTFDPADRYLFRTPPLANVALTAPYGHSGSMATMSDAIRAHSDPLAVVNTAAMSAAERDELYHRLRQWARTYPSHARLTDGDVEHLVAFLNTLTFCGPGRPDGLEFCPPVRAAAID